MHDPAPLCDTTCIRNRMPRNKSQAARRHDKMKDPKGRKT